MKRWMPFIALISAAVVMSVYMYIWGQSSRYKPNTDDPAVIYREACAECHGVKGEGTGVLYPALNDVTVSRRGALNSIRKGEMLMPAFTEIRGDTLETLAEYVAQQGYLSSEEPEKKNQD
jgi:mono/diheme cytochrome c family protein